MKETTTSLSKENKMLQGDNITFEIKFQGYSCNSSEIDNKGKKVMHWISTANAKEKRCPECGEKVHSHGYTKIRLYDVPYEPGYPTIYEVKHRRYKCTKCQSTFKDSIPFKVPGFNLTIRCFKWICGMLRFSLPTKTIATLIGIHWNTVRKIEKRAIELFLERKEEERIASNYKPYYLAVDEFAIHKGHKYATCVMDLVTGEVIWVGKGRATKDFVKFFEYFEGTGYLSAVKAFAMDMNASYNNLVQYYMPWVKIVYDRYHVQAQFGRDVLGQVRLEEARKHKTNANTMRETNNGTKEEIATEKRAYSRIKKARWLVLERNEKLSIEKERALGEILATHTDLAVCYAMKEELIHLFEIVDSAVAKEKWTQWFEGAKASNIPALMKFARQKEKRLSGLIAHADFPINTGKLEGFNNKIKVAKRSAYGFQNLDYFFSYIRYLSLAK